MSQNTSNTASSSSEGNSLKRGRTSGDATHPTSLENCVRSPTFWQEEGTIILRVQDTLFRVHRDLLSRHFPVFKDAFAIPQPIEAEQVDGCRVIMQSGDEPDDWETALTLMYCPLDIHPWHNKLTATEICSLLRLAHKYQGDQLFKECVERLKSEFPTTLKKFQELYYGDRYPFGGIVSEVHGRASLAGDLQGHIAIINTAVQLELECVLPCAYLLLSIYYEPSAYLLPPPGPAGEEIALSTTAVQSLLLGSSKIYPAMLKSFGRWICPKPDSWSWWCRDSFEDYVASRAGDPDFEIPDPPACPRDFSAIHGRVAEEILCERSIKIFFLTSHTTGMFNPEIFRGICDLCRRKEAEFRTNVQLQFWRDMPAAFGVGSQWSDLQYFN